MPLHRRHVLALAAGSSTVLGVMPLWAQARTPLLIEGKKTLYQRVLTRPGAAIAVKPGEALGKPIEPFTVYFVYERSEQGGKPWLLVGAGSDGKTQGYLAEADTVPWRHMITLSFASPTTRERVLFFRDRNGLTDFMNGPDPASETTKLLKEIAAKGTLGPTNAVIAARSSP